MKAAASTAQCSTPRPTLPSTFATASRRFRSTRSRRQSVTDAYLLEENIAINGQPPSRLIAFFALVLSGGCVFDSKAVASSVLSRSLKSAEPKLYVAKAAPNCPPERLFPPHRSCIFVPVGDAERDVGSVLTRLIILAQKAGFDEMAIKDLSRPFCTEILIRHAAPTLRKNLFHAAEAIDTGRAMAFGWGPGPEVFNFLQSGSATAICAPWYVTVRRKGESWIHLIGSSPELIALEQVAKSPKLELLARWFDPERGLTCARFYRCGKLTSELELKGRETDPLEIETFRSSRHGKRFLQKFATVEEAVSGFYDSFGATLRGMTALVDKGRLLLRDDHDGQIGDADVDEMGYVALVPHTSRENPASAVLLQAIKLGDAKGVLEAIVAGASLEYLPDMKVSPLAAACDEQVAGDWLGACRALIEAGAPLNGYDWEDPVICDVNPLRDEHSNLVRLEALLNLGADINAQSRHFHVGRTALHNASSQGKLELVRLLLSRGARTDIRDAEGKTALEIAEEQCDHRGNASRRSSVPKTLLEGVLEAIDKTGNAYPEIVRLLREAQPKSAKRGKTNRVN